MSHFTYGDYLEKGVINSNFQKTDKESQWKIYVEIKDMAHMTPAKNPVKPRADLRSYMAANT